MKDVIEKMGLLARLKVADKDIQMVAEKFTRILHYVETLKQVDVTGLEATSHATENKDAFREDIAKKDPDSKEIVDGFFVVPKVIE